MAELLIAINNTCCDIVNGRYIVQLSRTLTNPKSVRVLDASVTFAAEVNDLVLICSDSLKSDEDDHIRTGTSIVNTLYTSILTTARATGITGNVTSFSIAHEPNKQLKQAQHSFITLNFYTGAAVVVTPTKFNIVLHFTF